MELMDRLEQAREDVELQEAQMLVKKAQLEAVNVNYRQAVQQQRRLDTLFQQGATSEQSMEKARADTGNLKGQLMIKQAELEESKVRLRQAQRRLQRLTELTQQRRQPATTPSTSQPKSKGTEKTENLERTLDRLQLELDILRRQLQQSPPAKKDTLPRVP
jgi:hypothetical protein